MPVHVRHRPDAPPAIEVTGPKGEEVGHERVISGIGSDPRTGSLADSLNAQRDPKSDQSRAVTCGDLDAARARRQKRKKQKKP